MTNTSDKPSAAPEDGADPTVNLAFPARPSFYRPGTFSRESSLGYQMRRIVITMLAHVDRRLESHGLTHAQWTPLFLIHQGRANTLAELSRDLQQDAGALTRTLDRLEAKGLCQRQRSKEDRRVVHVSLTPEGQAAVAPVPAVLCEVTNTLLNGFSQDEWVTLMGFLRRIQANAETLKDATDGPAAGTVPRGGLRDGVKR